MNTQSCLDSLMNNKPGSFDAPPWRLIHRRVLTKRCIWHQQVFLNNQIGWHPAGSPVVNTPWRPIYEYDKIEMLSRHDCLEHMSRSKRKNHVTPSFYISDAWKTIYTPLKFVMNGRSTILELCDECRSCPQYLELYSTVCCMEAII
jgi:hypothetical protein